MSYETVETRVDRLEALFGHFLTQMALIERRADERNQAAEARIARLEQEMGAFKDEMRAFKNEMLEFKNEMRAFKNEMLEFKNEMRAFKDEMGGFKDEMGAFKDEMLEFKDEMRAFKDEMRIFKDEMRQSLKEMNKKWGDLANKMGTIVEDILAPNLRRIAREHFKFSEITYFAIRCERARHDDLSVKCEFDAVVAGPEAVILGEARSTPRLEDSDKFAEKGADFFSFFPELSGRRLILVFGSWSIPDGVVAGLTARGIYAMQMGDETMELVNAAELER